MPATSCDHPIETPVRHTPQDRNNNSNSDPMRRPLRPVSHRGAHLNEWFGAEYLADPPVC
jgi:hypothetical protein